MAKKKQKAPEKKEQSSNMVTNLYLKGMVKDVDSSYMDKESWVHARNAINNSIEGDTGVIGNEPANLLCANIPYTIIGGIHLYGDKWIIFSTDNDGTDNSKSSEIGEFDDSLCTYNTLVNDNCLNFHKDSIIIGVAKENFDCGWQIYWDDGRNPSRTLPISKVPYQQYQSSDVGVDCVTYENIIPLQLDCEKIRLAPLLDTPTLTLSKAPDGGQLANGMYQVFIAYSHNDQIIGDYIGMSNPQPLWSFENNGGALDLKISNLDKEFEYIQVVVRTRVHNGYPAYILGYYSTETTQISIDYLDPDLEKVLSSTLLLQNPAYEKSKGMFEVNDYLIRSQPTELFDFNYQPLANLIETEWTSTEYPNNYYSNGGNKPTFLRDEVYTFFIRFIYNTGEKSSSYHIPGRPAEINVNLNGANEDALDTSANNFTNSEKVFKVHNTASFSGFLSGTTDDGGTLLSYGKMGYWEAKSERYPATDPVRWGGLCGKLIRHHKMPNENTHSTTRLSDGAWQLLGGNSANNINIIGVQFSNIAAPRDNAGNIIQNIKGYQILVGNRYGNKSIIAKGIIRNMMSYERNEHFRSLNETNHEFGGITDTGYLNNKIGPMAARSWDLTNANDSPIGQSAINFGLMPNYPYNDTQTDPFLNHRGTGDVDPIYSPWFAGLLGGPPVESNWITGKGVLLRNDTETSVHYSAELGNDLHSRGLNEFTRNYHTFHSPDLNFTHMYLAPSELVVYHTLTGTQTGQFIKSEKHPKAKLLKNKAVLIAAIIGVGYALNKMRGQRNVKINTAKSQSTGETMAVGSGMTPMPGTGTAAAAVNVLLSIPGTIIGAVAEIGFNTVVDVASIFGAGKLARQITAPLYQTIEQATTGLMAGHLGPNKSIEYVGNDYTSVPTLFSMITGILSFLNYVAIGGDKIIELILALVDFQDYAYKYNSHGFYSTYNPFIGGSVIQDLGTVSLDGISTEDGVPSGIFRHQVERSRYIKQGINYFDGDIPINNLHRPSTVVIKTASNIDSPSNHGYIDNSKFTIGGGKCAGIYNYNASPVPTVDRPSQTLSWWSPTGIVTTSIAAQYVGLKVDNDNQYGQLDSILFTPIAQPFRFLDSIGITTQADINQSTRFQTGTLYGGDTYIARYTEKVTMPLWTEFMKDGPDGLPFDYRYYSNIPFPRYWMNTEKFRMDDFVKPIKSLSFNFDEAFPSDMYHLDAPTVVDCAAINAEYVSGGSGNTTSNYNEELNFHLEVVEVPKSGNIMATLTNKSKAPTWEIAGVASAKFIKHPPEDNSWYQGTGIAPPVDTAGQEVFEPEREREVAAGIAGRHKNHGHGTPLIDLSKSWDCITSKSDDWYDFCNPGGDATPPTKTDIDGVSEKFKALYNWNTGNFEHPVLWNTPLGVIGDPTYSARCLHQGLCFLNGAMQPKGTTLKQCKQMNTMLPFAAVPGAFSGFADDLIPIPPTALSGWSGWIDSCVPENDPFDFRYWSQKQRKKEKGWFSGTVKLDSGSFNVGGNLFTFTPSTSVGGVEGCSGDRPRFCRPGNIERTYAVGNTQGLTVRPPAGGATGLNPDGCYNDTTHTLIVKGGKPPKASDVGGNNDKYSDLYSDDDVEDSGKKKPGGLFVETDGYIYTHISGVNDFYVESDMNLSFRDWEDVPRKRHYDNEEFTDINLLFHADHIKSDNYYKYDKSLNLKQLWTASFGNIQPRYYDPLISESCFVNYPKRLLYSLPSVGTHTKQLQQFKRDEVADHWRTFLPQNFRDFKSKVNTIVSTSQTESLVLFPTLSPQIFTAADSLALNKSKNKLIIGDGTLFSQPFQSVGTSNVSHEFGSCESSRSVISTPSGIYFASQAQGKIFRYGGKGLAVISDSGMKWWFNKYLPSQLLKAFPIIEDYPQVIDNPVIAAGVQSIYDPNNDLLYFSKRDYAPVDLYQNTDCLQYIPGEGFVYNLTNCDGSPQLTECLPGYTLNTQNECCKISEYTELAEVLANNMIEFDIKNAEVDSNGCTCPTITNVFSETITYVLDQNPNNNPCVAPLPDEPFPPVPQCISCSCPPGYTMVGTCNNSASLPLCKMMECECPVPSSTFFIFNSNETLTQTGECDDIDLIGTPGYVNSNPLTCYYRYEECLPSILADQTAGISLTDTDYFKDVSWTVSYDPKAEAWISFHDWHPELAFNSINHFLTTKKSISETPICPPGYTYNGTTELCEVSAQGSEAAAFIFDQILATNTSVDIAASNSYSGATPCLLDVVVAVDVSGSVGYATTSSGTHSALGQAQNDFVTSLITHFSSYMTAGELQFGMMKWATNQDLIQCGSEHLTTNITAANNAVSEIYQNTTTGTGTTFGSGLNGALEQLNKAQTDTANCSLGDRTGQPNFRRVILFVTDAGGGFSTANITTAQNAWPTTDIYGIRTVAGTGNPSAANELSWRTILQPGSGTIGTPHSNPSTGFVGGDYDMTAAGNVTTLNSVAQSITASVCTPPAVCDCPDSSYTMVGNCSATETPRCIKNECSCPTVVPAYTLVGTCDAASSPTCERNICTCSSTPGYGLYNPEGTPMNWETGTCASVGDPLMCNYDFSDAVVPNYDIAGIWRHNARTDKYVNFYNIDYPWEVDIIETTGQQVTTLRSIEYVLESYVYKNDGRDKFHVLDFNFDEAEIYNSEQTSGLLKLNISPKNNAPLITTYPIINATDISILYSKEEQKYRFNQFWDVTLDRGEFSAIQNTIYITRLNGYIKDLNMANINLLKSSFERKKFRHYYNNVVLRRSVSDDKKMLLKLQNTKLNISSR